MCGGLDSHKRKNNQETFQNKTKIYSRNSNMPPPMTVK